MKTNRTMTAKELYEMTKSHSIEKLSDCCAERLTVIDYVLREDVNSDGEVVQVLTIRTVDGHLYGTISASFIRDFVAIIECGVEMPCEIEIIRNKGRSGRTFLTCEWC